MDAISLTTLVDDHLRRAREAAAGRSAATLHGGHDHRLRQTLVALLAGRALEEHESPGEATLQVLRGRVRLVAGTASQDLEAGQLVAIPPARHALEAPEDAVVLLTVVKRLGHED
ncbi:cupin domain-containing protein [Trujillonella humicola]|uniref:cupin domain-containing protein n=1 Tax=Trujillonella humicola TaxID=3383699 RepID=UPI003905C7DD